MRNENLIRDTKFYLYSKYGINLDKDNILKFSDTLQIPNFYKIHISPMMDWEICHLLLKIFGDSYYLHGITCYESLNKRITDSDIVIDCGANLGLFSAYAASQGAKVYAFEPSPITLPYLRQVQELYKDNLTICEYALSDENCIKDLLCCDNYGATHISTIDINNNHKVEEVSKIECIKLDDFIRYENIYPTFIKADIEGSEIFMLKGFINYISSNKPTISLTTSHCSDDYEKITKIIQENNVDYSIEQYKEFLLFY